ncbi:MAG: hypothetical protein ACTHMM_13510 [Agriterribacter sp.]
MQNTPISVSKTEQTEKTLSELETQKKLLELEKLRVEIKDQTRNPFSKFSTYPPLMTFLIAVIGGYATFSSGFLNHQRLQLQTKAVQTQKKNLEFDKQRLAEDTMSLSRDVLQLSQSRKKLVEDTTKLHREFEKLRSSFEQKQKMLLQKNRTRSALKSEILDFTSRVKKEYTDAENKDKLVRQTYEKEQKKLDNLRNESAAYNQKMDSLSNIYVLNAPAYKEGVTNQFDIIDFATAKFYREQLMAELPAADHQQFEQLYQSPPKTEQLVKAVLDNLETLAKEL